LSNTANKYDSTLDEILTRLKSLETSNAALKTENADLQKRLTTVEKNNVELEEALQTTMAAVIGVSSTRHY
jgi:regulator of replication initiation timing